MINQDISTLANYPIGPTLSQWMGFEKAINTKDHITQPSLRQRELFVEHTADLIKQSKVDSSENLTNLVDELVGMAEPLLALMMIDHNAHLWDIYDFRSCHTEGIAGMLCGELDRAEEAFERAQRINPKEPACYTNLAKIILHKEGSYQEAWQWLETGLLYTPDHFPLWEQVFSVAQTLNKDLLTLAETYNSWVGICCAFDTAQTIDVQKKANKLESFFIQGERSEDFMVEWTAALGQAGQYEKVLQVITQAFPLQTEKMPWKLGIHRLQAHLALEHQAAFRKEAEQLLQNSALPTEVSAHLHQLIEENGSH